MEQSLISRESGGWLTRVSLLLIAASGVGVGWRKYAQNECSPQLFLPIVILWIHHWNPADDPVRCAGASAGRAAGIVWTWS